MILIFHLTWLSLQKNLIIMKNENIILNIFIPIISRYVWTLYII